MSCPVCAQHTPIEAAEAEGIVLTGVEALINEDDATVEPVFNEITPWIGHAAISLYAVALRDLSYLTDIDMRELIAEFRDIINARLAAG